MEGRSVGRPKSPAALTKTGVRFVFWISLDEHAGLVRAARMQRLSVGAVLRQLVREFLAAESTATDAEQP